MNRSEPSPAVQLEKLLELVDSYEDAMLKSPGPPSIRQVSGLVLELQGLLERAVRDALRGGSNTTDGLVTAMMGARFTEAYLVLRDDFSVDDDPREFVKALTEYVRRTMRERLLKGVES